MNILVLYVINEKKPRKTIEDSLYCFSEYDNTNTYYYLNIFDTFSLDEVRKYTSEFEKISAVIIHYSAIALRYDSVWWKRNYEKIVDLINKFKCPKLIIPQDEYNYTADIHKIIKDTKIEAIYTCANEEDYEKLYPRSLGYKKISTVFTGYVDEKTLSMIQNRTNIGKRPIDIGYRARKLPYWLGKHGQLKAELADQIGKYLEDHETGLTYDIANTSDRNSKVYLGSDWIDFLLNCRTMLGCLGGSGLIDYDGSLKIKVDKYMEANPTACFEECEEACFPGKDNEIHLFALSPRHFECAMTRTCQLLVEGDYAGVFEAGRDYIEIKKDFSNISQVIEKVKDVSYCEKIADNCYENVVNSGKYTYSSFVHDVISYKNIIDKGQDYLHELNKYCRISKIEATCDYGLFNYKLIKAGGCHSFKRFFNLRYIKMRIRLVLLSIIGIVAKTPFRNTKIYDFFRKQYRAKYRAQ